MKQKLVILTTHFGSDFSGGSTATCEIFSRIEKSFDQIDVLGTKIGRHPFEAINFYRYHNWLHAINLIRQYAREKVIFYGDFYNSILFVLVGVRFYFTYHDNWPEQQNLNFTNRIKSLFYTSIYNIIFRRAAYVITVSQFKQEYIRRFNVNTKVISNGFVRSQPDKLNSVHGSENSILMVGNIDKRKYNLALPLFNKLNEEPKLIIDIYGHIIDQKLASKLQKFSFVNLKGYCHHIPYQKYKMLLHTSISESFGIVFCEAIYNGVPVIAFDTGGAKEIVSKENGCLVEPYNINAMISAIRNYQANNVITNPKSISQYSWETASKSYLKIFK